MIPMIAGITISPIYSYIYSRHFVIISDPVEERKNMIQNQLGEPLKNAIQEVKKNISSIST